jgi:hypothetical protein
MMREAPETKRRSRNPSVTTKVRHVIECEGIFDPSSVSRRVPNSAPALLIRTSIGGSRLAISAANRFISAKRVRSAKYTEWTAPGPLRRSRANVASARDLLRATRPSELVFAQRLRQFLMCHLL